MKINTFTYTKKDGSVSNRVLAVQVSPNTMYEGMDITELEVADQVMFADAMNKAHDAYLAEIQKVKHDFDVYNQYRRFDPKLMTNVVTETI